MTEIIYTITSNETDVSSRYTMKFIKTHALMSTYLTELIANTQSHDLGTVPTTAAALKCVDDYIKHHAVDEEHAKNAINNSHILYHEICHLDLNDRFHCDEYDAKMFEGHNIISSQFFIDVALCSFSLKIKPLIVHIAKNIAYFFRVIIGTNDNSMSIDILNSNVHDKVGRIILDNNLMPTHRLLHYHNGDSINKIIDELSKTEEYRNFMASLFVKYLDYDQHVDNEYPFYGSYQKLANILFLIHQNKNCHFYPLKMYLPSVFNLLLPSIVNERFNVNDFTLPGGHFELELLCQSNEEKLSEIITLRIGAFGVPKYPKEISRLKNLKIIFANKSQYTPVPPEGFKIVYIGPEKQSEHGGWDNYVSHRDYVMTKI